MNFSNIIFHLFENLCLLLTVILNYFCFSLAILENHLIIILLNLAIFRVNWHHSILKEVYRDILLDFSINSCFNNLCVCNLSDLISFVSNILKNLNRFFLLTENNLSLSIIFEVNMALSFYYISCLNFFYFLKIFIK